MSWLSLDPSIQLDGKTRIRDNYPRLIDTLQQEIALMKKFYESSVLSSLSSGWKWLFLIGVTLPACACSVGMFFNARTTKEIADSTANLTGQSDPSRYIPLYILATVMLLVALAGIYFSRRVPPTLELVFEDDGLTLNKDYKTRKEEVWKLAWSQVRRAEYTRIKLPQGGTASGRLTLEAEGQAAPLLIDFAKFLNDRVKILYTLHLHLQKVGQQIEGFSVTALPANEIFQLLGFNDELFARREPDKVQFYEFSYSTYPAQLQKDVLGLFDAVQNLATELLLHMDPAALARLTQINSRVLIVGDASAPVWHADDMKHALSVDELLALRGNWAVVAPVGSIGVPGAKTVGVYSDALHLSLAVSQTMKTLLDAEALINKGKN
jgi:hypothetical protein